MSKPSARRREKKQQHEKAAKARVMARREVYRRRLKDNAQMDKEERDTQTKQQPIRNEDFYRAKELLTWEVKDNLQRNMEILKGLEEEYAQENPGKSLLEVTEENLAKNEIVEKLRNQNFS